MQSTLGVPQTSRAADGPPPVSWQRVSDDSGVLHGFRLDAGPDWRLAAACGRGPARGVFVDADLPLCPDCRTILSRVASPPAAVAPASEAPADPPPVQPPAAPRPDLARVLEALRASGATVEELDADHVRVLYDASNREQWIAIDDLCDAVAGHATLEGEGLFESAPNNWVAIHFDRATCGRSRRPASG